MGHSHVEQFCEACSGPTRHLQVKVQAPGRPMSQRRMSNDLAHCCACAAMKRSYLRFITAIVQPTAKIGIGA